MAYLLRSVLQLLLIAILGSLSLCGQWKKGTAPPLIPRKALFEAADYYDITLSPNGKYLAWIADVEKVSNVWIKEMPDGTARNVTYETGRGIYGVAWLFDNKTLTYAQDRNGDENWRLYMLNVETADVQVVTDLDGVRTSVLAKSIKYPDLLIIGINGRDPKFEDAYRLNMTTGNSSLLFQNDYFSGYVFDDDMQIRMLTNETDEGGVNYYKYEVGKVSLYRTLDLDDMEMVHPLRFDASGRKLYWKDNNGKDLPSYYEVDWTSNKKRLIYEPKKAEVSDIVFHPITKKPVYVTEYYAKPERILLDKTYWKDFEFLKKLVKTDNADVWIHDFSYDFQTWIVVLRTDSSPTAYYHYRRDAEPKATLMFYTKSSLLNYTFASTTSVEIPISDGLTQQCYLTLPLESVDSSNPDVPVRPIPMVLGVHGGPWIRQMWAFDVFVQFFANRGYAMLQCNFRSSTGFGKKFTTAGYGQWGQKMQQDLTDAVNWAIEKKIADPDKVAIYGGSYGGYAVLAGLAFTPDLYACGVDMMGPSNLMTLIKSVPAYWKPTYNRLVKRIGADPRTESGRESLKKASPLYYADKIKRPLLIGQGANDPRVKRNESDQIVDALKSSKTPVAYVLFSNEGHGFVRNENRLAFYGITEQFLQQCLGGRAEPMSDEIGRSSASIFSTIDNIKGSDKNNK